MSPFRNVIDELFALRQIYNDENDDVRQLLVKLLLNSLYGERIRKNMEENFAYISQDWMMSEFDEKVRDYWKIGFGEDIVKMTDDAGLEEEIKNLNTMPLHFGAFVLSNSKRRTKKFYLLREDFLQMFFIIQIRKFYILKINRGINWIKQD